MTTLPTMLPTPGVRAGAEVWDDDLRRLLGCDAGGLLDAAVVAAGGQLASWQARQVTHRPARSTVVQYRAEVRWRSDRTTVETFVAAVGDRVPAPGAAVFCDGTAEVALWRWPADPYLPGLARALDAGAVASLLDGLGAGGDRVRLRARAYRPGRRAVVEATGRRGRIFLKVVRPEDVEALHDVHRRLARDLPVPDSLGWTSDGVLALTARPGRTLREALRSTRHPLPAPAAIAELLDRQPPSRTVGVAHRDLLSSAEHHAAVIAATVPGTGASLEGLLHDLRTERADPGPVVPVHGDLHEAQLLVEAGVVTGLLDVDTVGPGHRIDDLATFCAHLSVLAQATDRPRRAARYPTALVAHAEQDHDPAELRRRIAAAVVGLATGPFRVLEPRWRQATDQRLALARRWLDDADTR